MRFELRGVRVVIERINHVPVESDDPYLYVITAPVGFGYKGKKQGAPLSSWRRMVIHPDLMHTIEQVAQDVPGAWGSVLLTGVPDPVRVVRER
jgi:hypothetical protein